MNSKHPTDRHDLKSRVTAFGYDADERMLGRIRQWFGQRRPNDVELRYAAEQINIAETLWNAFP